uniref:Uncharacterized protein n=1 Tax=Trichogramma kaykai TaxID=54128 RepID=A0ABD2XNG7_9HYME
MRNVYTFLFFFVNVAEVPKSAETATVGGDSSTQHSAASTTEAAEAEASHDRTAKDRAEHKAAERDEEDDDEGEDDKGKAEEAAIRIQAAFRGHQTRKTIQVQKRDDDCNNLQHITRDVESSSNTEPTREELEAEFREDDKDLLKAATKIQATFRGQMSRKIDQAAGAAKELVGSAASKVEEKVTDTVNELEGIDLSDPDLHKAATKIQASFRGHKVRQEVVPNPDEKK